MKLARWIPIVALVVLLPTGSDARQRGLVAPKLPFVKYKLKNGLEVILHRDPSLPLVSVNVWYHVGAANERPGRSGFAHLFEHVMFEGSAHIPDGAHFKLLQQAGASDVNGTTGYDRTNYYQTLPRNQLELALWLESDRMGFLLPALTQKKLDVQRRVVKNERRQRIDNVPYGKAREAMCQALFPPPHPYGGCVIGSMRDLDAATLSDVKGFFRTYYAPSNATLVIAGDFDPKRARRLVSKYFAPLRTTARPARPRVKAPRHSGVTRRILRDRVRFKKVMIGWVTPSYFQPGDADLDILSMVLARGKSSRLHRALVYDQQVAVGVSAHQASTGNGSSFVITATGAGKLDARELEKRLWDQLERVKRGGITAAELTRARNVLQTTFFQSLQSVSARANILNKYNHFLGDPGALGKDLARYAKVTRRGVQDAAKRYLKAGGRVVIHVLPLSRSGR